MKQRHFVSATIAALTIGVAGAVSAQAVTDGLLQNMQKRVELINRITKQFEPEAAAQAGRNFNSADWKREFGSRLLYQSPEALASAVNAADLATAQNVLASAAGKPTAKHTSNDNEELHLVSPCRVTDTRFAGGPFPGNAWRFEEVAGTAATIAAQGGAAAGCPAPLGVQGFLLVVSVVPFGAPLSGGANFLTVQHNASPTPPTTASMNYYPGIITSEFVVSECNGGCPTTPDGGVEIYTSGPVHVIVDFVGWLGNAAPTALDCVHNEASNSVSVAANSTNSVLSGLCQTGYTLTGGGCYSTNGTQNLIRDSTMGYASFGNAGRWFCNVFNNSNSTINVNVDTICCRTPLLN